MIREVVLKTSLPLPMFKRGKVRDIYDLGKRLLIFSTDRISAFDVVLPNGIPCKGEALTRISVYWFNETNKIVPNHVIDVVDPQILLVKKAQPIRIEFVVRGYLYGSAWENYQKHKPVSGLHLSGGLKKAEQLPDPLLTPTTKAEMGHDTEITMKEVEKNVGKDLAREIEEACLKIYERGSKKAKANNVIIADTKMEFGIYENRLVLIDELLTPDSSRFWAAEDYEIGKTQPSFDKQYVRDYLLSTGWNREPPAPDLPKNVILETAKKYVEAYVRLTSREF